MKTTRDDHMKSPEDLEYQRALTQEYKVTLITDYIQKCLNQEYSSGVTIRISRPLRPLYQNADSLWSDPQTRQDIVKRLARFGWSSRWDITTIYVTALVKPEKSEIVKFDFVQWLKDLLGK